MYNSVSSQHHTYTCAHRNRSCHAGDDCCVTISRNGKIRPAICIFHENLHLARKNLRALWINRHGESPGTLLVKAHTLFLGRTVAHPKDSLRRVFPENLLAFSGCRCEAYGTAAHACAGGSEDARSTDSHIWVSRCHSHKPHPAAPSAD